MWKTMYYSGSQPISLSRLLHSETLSLMWYMEGSRRAARFLRNIGTPTWRGQSTAVGDHTPTHYPTTRDGGLMTVFSSTAVASAGRSKTLRRKNTTCTFLSATYLWIVRLKQEMNWGNPREPTAFGVGARARRQIAEPLKGKRVRTFTGRRRSAQQRI